MSSSMSPRAMSALRGIVDPQRQFDDVEGIADNDNRQEIAVKEEHVIRAKEEEPIVEDVLSRHTETTRDYEVPNKFFQKLKVEAVTTTATDVLRLVVVQKSRGGIPRRVAAAVIPLSDLLSQTTPPEPSWIQATNVGPRGTLSRNGEILASVWIEGDDDERRSFSRFSEYMTPTDAKTSTSQKNKNYTKDKYIINFFGLSIIALVFAYLTYSAHNIISSFKYFSYICSWQVIKISLLCFGVSALFFSSSVVPCLMGKTLAYMIERYGLLSVCRVQCDSLRLSCFVVKSSADELPPRSDTIKKQSREAKRAAAKAGKLGAALVAATPKGRHWRLVLALEARGFRFFNPSASRYPHEHLASVKQLQLCLSLPLRHVLPALKRIRNCHWRPSPRKCVAAFGLLSSSATSVMKKETTTDFDEEKEKSENNDDDDYSWRRKTAQPRATRPEVAAVIVVEKFDLLGPQVNLEMDAASELNVVALTRDLADAKVAALLPKHQYAPNSLCIQILQARNVPRQVPSQQQGGSSFFLTAGRRSSSCLIPGESMISGCRRGDTEHNIDPTERSKSARTIKTSRDTSPPVPTTPQGCRPGQLLVVRCRIRNEKCDSRPSSSLTEHEHQRLGASWNNENISFSGRTDDASAVLSLELFVVDSARSKPKHSIGRWLTTLEALANRPRVRLVHTDDDFCVRRSANRAKSASFEVEGWFPLRDSELEYFDPNDASAEHLGAIRLRICWRHQNRDENHFSTGPSFSFQDSSTQQDNTSVNSASKSSSFTKTAMDQLVENSLETKLRIGSLRYTARMLSTFPLLLDIRSIVLADVIVRLHDIFMGKAGQSVLGTGEHARIQIPSIIIDGDTFIHRDPLHGAVSIFDFLRDFFIRGCGEKMFSTSFIYQLLSAISVVPR
uniref:Uncharacterized protein n=1 Tax=Aureoumbra lagunensis TaxID=44058 RepID=A0A7S3JQA0_9STRA